ncbi:MAG: DUF4912 domain-containing protein [Planctomycetaceae bacterium]|nr:DUF4912 domain-containing protein [Planctomycetaceae bacterium]
MTSEALKARSRKSLAALARKHGIARCHDLTKDELVRALLRVSRSKTAAPVAKRIKPVTNGAGRHGPPSAKLKKTASAPLYGHGSIARSRDLSTTAIDDLQPSGRTNFLDATDCDTNWILAKWDLTRDSIRRAESRLAADWHRALPVIRLFDVTTEEAGSVAEAFVKDVVIEAGVDTWYVNVPAQTRTFRLHIGYRTTGGKFFAVAKSNVCTMPLLNVDVEQEETPDGKASNGKANGKTNGHGQAGLADSHHANGRGTVGERQGTRLGRPLGFSSLSHFGPAATQEREKAEFSFKLDTELIVHGSTRPGSHLAVQGDPVDLRDDGSFTIRLNQPEGRQVIAFTAISPRGGERRMIVLGIERNTKELERQYFDGGHPEGYIE